MRSDEDQSLIGAMIHRFLQREPYRVLSVSTAVFLGVFTSLLPLMQLAGYMLLWLACWAGARILVSPLLKLNKEIESATPIGQLAGAPDVGEIFARQFGRLLRVHVITLAGLATGMWISSVGMHILFPAPQSVIPKLTPPIYGLFGNILFAGSGLFLCSWVHVVARRAAAGMALVGLALLIGSMLSLFVGVPGGGSLLLLSVIGAVQTAVGLWAESRARKDLFRYVGRN